jgi:hypothetical protein
VQIRPLISWWCEATMKEFQSASILCPPNNRKQYIDVLPKGQQGFVEVVA